MGNTLIYKIGIVGFGPKGLYGFERLLAQLNTVSITKPVEIHIFNKTHFFGAGDVYRNDQPECLIMNYANRNIDIWPLDLPKAVVENTSHFVSWSIKSGYTNTGENDFAPRSKVGDYLMHSFQAMLDNLPNNVKVHTHVGSVSRVENQNGSYKLIWEDTNSSVESSILFQKILFTTGHTSFKSLKTVKPKSDYKVDFIYPTNDKLEPIPSNSSVAIKGMGLTAIDAILALTEGKGGIFRKDGHGTILYQPSGKEPMKMYVFSRSGLPMVPRNGSEPSTSKLYYFTEQVIENFQNNKPISFGSTLLPLIKKEFYFAFYSTLFKKYGHQLSFNLDFTAIENQVKSFHDKYVGSVVFNWNNIINPFEDKRFLSTKIVQEYIEYLIQEAELGEDKSPFMAAVASWRKISPIFNELYSYGGLDAVSHRDFDSYYFGLFNRLAYGPPIKNMKKIHALLNAGLLDFTFAKSATIGENKNDDKFKLIEKKGSQKVSIDYLVNATIPRAKENSFENELYQNLNKNGLIKPFENKLKTTYKPGCLAINKNGNPVEKNGIVNFDFTFYGTPTEGITFDNDTLSRTRNDFASIWAKMTCDAILEREGTIDNYERKQHVL